MEDDTIRNIWGRPPIYPYGHRAGTKEAEEVLRADLLFKQYPELMAPAGIKSAIELLNRWRALPPLT